MIPRAVDRVLSSAPGAVGAYYSAYKAYRWGDPYIRLVAALTDRSRLAVDVGAHLGDYTFFMRRHAAGCVAFECNPALVAHLRRRFGNSIDLRPDAVSSQSGTATLRIPQAVETGLGRATIEAANRLDRDFSGFDLVTVNTVTLDETIRGSVGLIKIDVEGHEMSVLQGATRILGQDRPNLIVELEDRHKPGCTAAAFEFLSGLGYRGAYLEAGTLVGVRPGGALKDGLWNFVFVHQDRSSAMFG